MTEARWGSSFRPRWMLATVLSVVGVLALTHIPQEAIPRVLQENAFDKVEHVVAYGVITTLFLMSLKRPIRPAVLVLGLAALAVIGALDEMTQPYVNRTASGADYVSDLIGMAMACTVFLIRGLLGRYRLGRQRDSAGKGTVPTRSA
jgi:VanZ family protein